MIGRSCRLQFGARIGGAIPKPFRARAIQWSVVAESGVEEYVDTEQMPSAASVLIDPFAPVCRVRRRSRRLRAHARGDGQPNESKQLIGSWGLNAVVPGDRAVSSTDGSTIIAAASLNLGQMGLAKWMATLPWDVARDGTAVLSMLDGSGSIRFIAQEEFADDSVHLRSNAKRWTKLCLVLACRKTISKHIRCR